MKKKKKKRFTPEDYDKMSFEKREKIRKKIKKETVYTKSFYTTQKFGAASECKTIKRDDPEYQELLKSYNKKENT